MDLLYKRPNMDVLIMGDIIKVDNSLGMYLFLDLIEGNEDIKNLVQSYIPEFQNHINLNG